MQKKLTKALVQRCLGAMKRSSKKMITLDNLSRLVGIYSDVLGDQLSYFDPMIRMDPSINCRDLIPAMQAYVDAPSETAAKKKAAGEKTIRIAKKEIARYPSIAKFVYTKMTNAGGLVDTSARLSDEDLELLKRLVDREIDARKKAAKKQKRK